MFEPDFYVATNHAGLRYEHIQAWATCHDEHIWRWAGERVGLGWRLPEIWLTDEQASRWAGNMAVHGAEYWEGSSGALGVSTAIAKGASKIVLCGIPLTNGPHFYKGDDFTWEAHYRRQWTTKLPALRDKVRSMSGWTAEQLGMPDKEWLESGK